MLLLHFQFCNFFEKQGITRATNITQHKPKVISTDKSITMFSVLVSIPPPPDLHYSIYVLTADENWTHFSMEVGHSLTLYSKWQHRHHFLCQVWIVYSDSVLLFFYSISFLPVASLATCSIKHYQVWKYYFRISPQSYISSSYVH